MKIAEREQDSFLIISVNGRIDASTSPQLQASFDRHVSAGKRFFVLDLQGVDYLSSGGLRLLLVVTRKVKEQSGGIVLANLHPFVEDLVTMAGFDKLIPTASSVEESINLLAIGETA